MSEFPAIHEQARPAAQIELQAVLLDAVSEGIVGTDLDARITYWSPSTEFLTGYEAAEVMGQRIFEVAPIAALRDRAVEINERVAVRGGRWAGELVVRRKDGSTFPGLLSISPIRGEDGEPTGTVAICRDFTRQKLEKERQHFLAEAGAVLASSLDYADTLERVARLAVPELADWCFVDLVAPDGSIRRVVSVHVDPRLEELSRELLQYPPSPDGPNITSRVLRTGETWLASEIPDAGLEELSHHPAHLETLRRLRPLSGVAAPLVARDRAIGVIRLATTDPARRRLHQDDVATVEALARLAALSIDNARLYRDANQAIKNHDQILGIVSHDLRNPLNIISMNTELLLLQQDASADAPEGKRLAAIQRSVHQMNRLIQDLLDVSVMESGALSIEKSPIPVVPLLSETHDSYRTLVEANNQHLEAKIPNGRPVVVGDHERVAQVFSNLIGNAVKFTPEGGRVTIGAEAMEGEVRFWVADTGPGIAEGDLDHVFDRFWQARRGGRRGAGLGLTTARGLVEAHGGRMWADSVPGRGATFSFTLPLAPEEG